MLIKNKLEFGGHFQPRKLERGQPNKSPKETSQVYIPTTNLAISCAPSCIYFLTPNLKIDSNILQKKTEATINGTSFFLCLLLTCFLVNAPTLFLLGLHSLKNCTKFVIVNRGILNLFN